MFSSKFGKLLLKSFCVAFFKKRLGFGATPHNNAVFGSFCGNFAKKNGENFLNISCPNSFRSFFEQVGTKKEPKKCR